jgi:hypothetical protein
VTESTTVDNQQQLPLLSEFASGVHDTDEADDESYVANCQSDDIVSGGASDSPIAHRIQRQRQPPNRYGEWITLVARAEVQLLSL